MSQQRKKLLFVFGLFILLFSIIALPALAAPTAQTSCTAPAWQAGEIYTGGDLVSHAGHQWRAKWWTTNEEPGTTGQWGVWEDQGVCGDVTPTTEPTVEPTTVPPTTVPPTDPPPTSPPGGSCTEPQYVAGTTYNAGDLVQNVGNKYECNIGGWCSSSAAWAYEPGVGMYWQEAWSLM